MKRSAAICKLIFLIVFGAPAHLHFNRNRKMFDFVDGFENDRREKEFQLELLRLMIEKCSKRAEAKHKSIETRCCCLCDSFRPVMGILNRSLSMRFKASTGGDVEITKLSVSVEIFRFIRLRKQKASRMKLFRSAIRNNEHHQHSLKVRAKLSFWLLGGAHKKKLFSADISETSLYRIMAFEWSGKLFEGLFLCSSQMKSKPIE